MYLSADELLTQAIGSGDANNHVIAWLDGFLSIWDDLELDVA